MAERERSFPSSFIKALSVRGFKSFGDELQKFTFTRGINLIVGANGSGKSNILDAICFALCAKTSSLRVRYNAELQSTETKQPCEVTLQIVLAGVGGDEKLITLKATIGSDDSRIYTVDGRVKSAKDVKELLQDIGLHLESSGAAVFQSQVTELADTNSPKLISSIISNASGAGRWNEEVTKAQHEFNKIRKGLDDIEENIILLEKIIEKDQASLKDFSRMKQLESNISVVSDQLCAFLHGELTFLKSVIDEKVGLLNHKECTLNNRQHLLVKRQDKIDGMKKCLKVSSEELEDERSQITLSLAMKEEQRSAWERKVHDAKDAVLKIGHLDDVMKSLNQNISYINFQIEQKEHFISSIRKPNLKISGYEKPDNFYRELKHSVSFSEEKLKELVSERLNLDDNIKFLLNDRESKEWKLVELKQRLDTLREDVKLIKMPDNVHEMKTSSHQIAHLGNEREVLRNNLQSLRAELGILSDTESSLPAWPLHSCFSFKKAFEDRCSFFLALNIISGPLRRICVTETTEAAAELLRIWNKNGNTSRFSRIWPLDRLRIDDRYRQQKKAQQHYPGGSVILPIEQFEFDAKFEKAIKRIFQGYVISSSDEVAKDLVISHGIWNVTLDGKVSQLGSISGGWRGNQNSRYIQTKFEHDHVNTQLNSIDKQLASAKEEAKKMETIMHRFESCKLETEEKVSKIKRIEEQITELDDKMHRQKIALEENQRISAFLRKEIEANKIQLDMLTNNDYASENLLDQALKRARDEEATLQAMLDDLLHKQATINTERSILLSKASALDESVKTRNSYEDEIQQLKNKLLFTESKMEDAKRKQHNNDSLLHLETESVSKDIEMITELQEDIQKLKHNIITMKSDAKRIEEELKRLPESEADFTSLSKDKILSKADYNSKKRELNQMMEEVKRLKGKETQISFEQISCNDQFRKLELFKQRWMSIAESIDVLMEGIEKTRSKVQAANETSYKKIRQSFIDCCKLLLPNKRMDLAKTGQLVEDGIKFSLMGGKDVDRGISEEWKSNLEELSGGQRTIISLAFILTVAKCSHSSVYLMDEVDAALDEQNQQSLAKLIKNVIGEDRQVICVSHNIAFQQYCDRVIQVTRVDGSTEHVQSYDANARKISKKIKV